MKGLKSCTENFRFYPHSQHLPNFLRMTVLQDKQGGGSSKAGQDPVRKRQASTGSQHGEGRERHSPNLRGLAANLLHHLELCLRDTV